MKNKKEIADICVIYNGDPYPICGIEYYADEENDFCYVFTPYYDRIAGLPDTIFHGIQGIDLDLGKKYYVRKNFVPSFISERSPRPPRTDLEVLMKRAGIDEYNTLSWLKNTDLQYFGDGYFFMERSGI